MCFCGLSGGQDTVNEKERGRRMFVETERVKVCVLCIHCYRTLTRWCETRTRD